MYVLKKSMTIGNLDVCFKKINDDWQSGCISKKSMTRLAIWVF